MWHISYSFNFLELKQTVALLLQLDKWYLSQAQEILTNTAKKEMILEIKLDEENVWDYYHLTTYK